MGHDTIDRLTDPASYWDFYILDYATDVLAFGAGIQAKQTELGAAADQKAVYFGYSLGTM